MFSASKTVESPFSRLKGTTTSAVAGVAMRQAIQSLPTPFRVGSISKPFVATMVLQLVDEEVSTSTRRCRRSCPTPDRRRRSDPHVARPWQRPAQLQRPVSLHPRHVRGSQSSVHSQRDPGLGGRRGDRRTRQNFAYSDTTTSCSASSLNGSPAPMWTQRCASGSANLSDSKPPASPPSQPPTPMASPGRGHPGVRR